MPVTIPREAAEVLRPVLPELADETIAAIGREVPDYARAMEGPFGRAVRGGVELALGRFVDGISDPEAMARAAHDPAYAALGRGELRAGRSLDALLAAYRVGARVSWRRFVRAGVARGIAAETLYALGEAIFAYIDAISAESAAGYAEEQSARAGERERRRRALIGLLAARPPADEEAIRTAAAAGDWALPRTVAALAVPGEADPERLARAIGLAAVGGTTAADGALVFVPDPDAPKRRAGIEAALGDAGAGLGPTVGWREAGVSAGRAVAAARLGRAGLVVADNHLVILALHADPGLATALAHRGLAPLADVEPAAREKLVETLRAWLDRPGQVQAVAAVLDVHPQTVRYRLKGLRERYGTALEDPEERLALALALRVTTRDE